MRVFCVTPLEEYTLEGGTIRVELKVVSETTSGEGVVSAILTDELAVVVKVVVLDETLGLACTDVDFFVDRELVLLLELDFTEVVLLALAFVEVVDGL